MKLYSLKLHERGFKGARRIEAEDDERSSISVGRIAAIDDDPAYE
jgi:hypothetical protein